MPMIVIGSVSGAPGVTTSALALAATWPQPVLVVEADASGGDLIVRLDLNPERGAASLAAQQRHFPANGTVAPHLQSVRVADRSIDVLAAPVGSAEAAASIAAVLARVPFRQLNTTVIVDIGRLGPPGPSTSATTWSLLSMADFALLVSSGRPDALAHVAAAYGVVKQAAGECLRLLVVEDGPYDADEINSAFHCPGITMIPHDVRSVGLLHRNGPQTVARTALGRVFQQLSKKLAGTSVDGLRELPSCVAPVSPPVASTPLMWRTR
ncbi:hypothetical protein [Fodinicola acaciae]|uniref:hypothetical protein n=1 Tax=Fodinicola acaciae TaxID=2681555 RepID=UPI0013D58D0D|nr:hypothetical protein [Fodinicola acaciae]